MPSYDTYQKDAIKSVTVQVKITILQQKPEKGKKQKKKKEGRKKQKR
jgi:hypothetical protein